MCVIETNGMLLCDECWADAWKRCPKGTRFAVRNPRVKEEEWMICRLCAADGEYALARRTIAAMESALRKIGTPEALAALALAEGVRNG